MTDISQWTGYTSCCC